MCLLLASPAALSCSCGKALWLFKCSEHRSLNSSITRTRQKHEQEARLVLVVEPLAGLNLKSEAVPTIKSRDEDRSVRNQTALKVHEDKKSNRLKNFVVASPYRLRRRSVQHVWETNTFTSRDSSTTLVELQD